jgi:YbbR domain-containing protein
MDKWFRSNNVIKVISVILAVMLWLVVNYDQQQAAPPAISTDTSITIYDVPLQIKYNQDQFELAEGPSSVTLVLRGNPAQIAAVSGRLLPDQYEVFVDLTGVTKGTQVRAPVQIKGLPANISAQALPAEVTVTLVEKERREINVSAELMGEPAEGYKLGRPIINPSRVYIKAAKKQLDQVAFVKAFVNVEDQSEPITHSYALKALDKNGNEVKVEIQPSVVEVTVPINSPSKVVPFLLSVTGQPPEGYAIADIKNSIDEVTVYGPKTAVDELEIYPGPTIDVSDYRADRVLQLQIPLLPGLTKIEPDHVEVRVDVVPSTTTDLEDIPVEVNGLKDGWKAKFQNDGTSQRINLTVEGAPSILSRLKASDVQAYVDVSNLALGEHTVPVKFNLPQFVRAVGHPEISVVLTEPSGTGGDVASPSASTPASIPGSTPAN